MSKILPNGVKAYEQHFKDGTLYFGLEVGEMIFAKIDKKGGKAHLLTISDMNFTSAELRQIQGSMIHVFNISRGGFGQKGR